MTRRDSVVKSAFAAASPMAAAVPAQPRSLRASVKAASEEQVAAFGHTSRGTNLRSAHSRLTAYAPAETSDPQLAQRAWSEYDNERGCPTSLDTGKITRPAVLNPVDEAPSVLTNDSSQWGLAAIRNLALMPETL